MKVDDRKVTSATARLLEQTVLTPSEFVLDDAGVASGPDFRSSLRSQ